MIVVPYELQGVNHHYELECAKRAVEIAVEQDEQTAIDYLENETEEIE